MDPEAEKSRTERDGWPQPSRDVLRELERPPVAWSDETEYDSAAARRD